MFYQLCVPKKDRRFFRFLWWRDGNPNDDILEYQMTVHLFGAVSSPSVAIYFAEADWDYGIGSYGSPDNTDINTVAITSQLIEDLRKTCKDAGFNLTKFICNATEWVSECYQSLTAHQHQKGHTVPKQVIMIATSIQVVTV